MNDCSLKSLSQGKSIVQSSGKVISMMPVPCDRDATANDSAQQKKAKKIQEKFDREKQLGILREQLTFFDERMEFD